MPIVGGTRPWRFAALLSALFVVVGGMSAPASAQQDPVRVLVFHQTGHPDLRHASIEYGIAAIREMGAQHGFTVDETRESAVFTDEGLAAYDAVVWLNVIAPSFTDAQRAAFERYITGGGGYVGVHGPAGMESNWPWYYNELVGTFYHSHPYPPRFPETQRATIRVEDRDHPSTAHLPAEWEFTEEWWNFYGSVRQDAHVLASLDESTYQPGPGAMGDHPVTWCREPAGGRAWYTNLGHSIETYADPAFRAHLLGGIQYANGQEPGDCGGRATRPARDFARTTLAGGSGSTSLAVLPDRGVLHAAPDGQVWLTGADGTTNRAAAFRGHLHGIAVDPASPRWVYVYLDDHVSRFPLRGHVLDRRGEQRVIDAPGGGDLGFDRDGNLLVSTGDDTDTTGSAGYAPLDERPGHATRDARRTAGSTDSLSGKLLRVTVGRDGGYTVPAGNLFPPGTPKTRPEIYAMGLRAPVRFSVDRPTGSVLVADHGPAAGAPDPARGPAGQAELTRLTAPGNLGWPYCAGANQPYAVAGTPFDCAAPRNTSPHNTGLVDLPPAVPASPAYDGESVPELTTGGSTPPFGNGGEAPMSGPTYRSGSTSETAFPPEYDGSAFVLDRDRGWVKELRPDGEIRPFQRFAGPTDAEFGPDGSLYVLDGAGLHRVDYAKGRRAPEVEVTTRPGADPREVVLHPAGTHDPDGDALRYEWDVDGDGRVDSTRAGELRHRYARPGEYRVTLKVTDTTGRSTVERTTAVAGNTRPAVTLTSPGDGVIAAPGETVPFSVAVSDDRPVDCARVRVEYTVDGRVAARGSGCEGSVTLPRGGGTLTAVYTDTGTPRLTGSASHVVHALEWEAESVAEAFGPRVTPLPAGGGARVGDLEQDDWLKLDRVDLTGVTGVSFRVSATAPGATITVQYHEVGGAALGTVEVPSTGDLDTYVDVALPAFTPPPGTEPLYFVVGGPPGVLTVDKVTFTKG
ncbi:ThuA domain-containing protein [Actinosynnema sp. NPDC049800]